MLGQQQVQTAEVGVVDNHAGLLASLFCKLFTRSASLYQKRETDQIKFCNLIRFLLL